MAVAELVRRGAHATAVPPSFSVEVFCTNGGRGRTNVKKRMLSVFLNYILMGVVVLETRRKRLEIRLYVRAGSYLDIGLTLKRPASVKWRLSAYN